MPVPSALLQDAVQNGAQLVGAGDATVPPFYLAIPEYDQGGHALYLVGSGYLGISIDIHFQDRNVVAHLVFYIL